MAYVVCFEPAEPIARCVECYCARGLQVRWRYKAHTWPPSGAPGDFKWVVTVGPYKTPNTLSSLSLTLNEYS